MKASHIAGVLVASLTILGGCATQREMARTVPNDRLNHAYMSEVEQIASERGVTVHWVNPPLTRVGGKDL